MSEAVPLAYADLKILQVESPTIAGHTCKVIRVAPPGVNFGTLFETVAKRIKDVPELHWKLGTKDRAPAWVKDKKFRLERHLVAYDFSHPVPVDQLNGIVSNLFSQRLDRDYPLWQIDVVNLDDGGAALIWRIHHALADGTTAMRLGRELLWEESATPGATVPAKSREAIREADNVRRRAHLIHLFEHEFKRSKGPSPFDGHIGTEREIAFATISLSDLHDSAKSSCGATLNDAVLSLVAGSLRQWLDVHHETHLGDIRVKVPVSLHHGDGDGANLDSYFLLPLPVNEPDPVKRLAEIHDGTGLRKSEHDAEELDALLKRLNHTSARLTRYYSKFEKDPRRFALNVSNVRGPHTDVTILGSQVESIHSIVEIADRHALRVAVVSLGDRLCFGFCADPELVADLGVMADGVEVEAERLHTAASPASA